MQFCLACGRARAPSEWSCPEPCGCGEYCDSVGAGRSPPAPQPTLGGVLGRLVTLPRGGVLVLYGERGCGKTTLALSSMKRPAVITTEMRPDLVAAYCDRLGVALARAGSPVLEAEEWTWPHEMGDADGIVLDSLNGEGPGHVASLLALGRGLAQTAQLPLVAIAQITVEGTVRGGEHAPHAADVVVRVERSTAAWRRVRVEKNRFGPEGTTLFRLGAAGPETQERDVYYYEVTGAEGRYRAEPYPWTRSEVWAAVEAGQLTAPAPPAAAAARRSGLYGGWVEPPDSAAREAFAEGLGIPYFRPGERHE